jgi:hypothetical protein
MDQHYEYFSDDEEDDSDKEQLKKIKKLKLEDFLNFQKTRKILEVEHLDNYFENCEKDIEKYYSKVKKHCKGQMSSALKFDVSSKGKGMITGLVYKYIDKNYNLEIFYENPELVGGLIAKLEENKNKKF